MTAQNPLKISFDFFDNDFHLREIDPAKELAKYNRNAFLVYQWGVFCTSWARFELQKMISIAGDGVKTESCFVYADTDSVKYTGNIDKGLEEYNRRQMEISKSNGAYAEDKNGNIHYMGVFEREADYDKFRTWGAKRYCYEQNGELFVTTAGVVKNKGGVKNIGGKELAKAGGIEAYKPGFTFYEAGGTESEYNDNVDFWIDVDGHKLHITDNVNILPSTYTLGIPGEYDFLLNHVELMIDLFYEFDRNKKLEC